MSTEPQPTIRSAANNADERTSEPFAPRSAAERADLEEDGGTQRALEDAELGGEG